MSKDSKKAEQGKVRARVLVDAPSHGLKADQVVEADEATIKALGDQVDAHPDAVAYALSAGAEVIAA
jgi:hypothetical protein